MTLTLDDLLAAHHKKPNVFEMPKRAYNGTWTRAETLGLSHPKCKQCKGEGTILKKKGKCSIPCSCVFRRIFRICLNRYLLIQDSGEFARMSIGTATGSGRRATYGFKGLEFSADLIGTARRSLTAEDFRIFRLHHLLGADWRVCCQRLQLDKGLFFHAVYKIESRLGRTFRDVQPYSLYPLDEYFGGVQITPAAKAEVLAMPTVMQDRRSYEIPLRTLAKAA